ncbi:MAG: UbiA prenyltransferase family protein [Spirochaetaceae bacterium]|nr:UbiA prenyltransferase family protein [Spirochaetaceae bacterium]
MSTLKDYAGLLRFHHYIKNLLIFIPLFFSFGFFNIRALAVSATGFVIFSVLSSIVYVLNDIQDREKDRLHPTKRLRPLAAGKIPVSRARVILWVLTAVLIILVSLLGILENRLTTWLGVGLLAVYLALNVGYSYGLKNIPLVDISILASGYVIRVLFGALIIGSAISVWLYLMITVGAYYLGLGKRRNEITTTGKEGETRAVIRFYSHNFLDKNMYMCQALCVVFYALWSIDTATVQRLHTNAFVYTIPLFLIIVLKYSLNIETASDGDPTSIVLHDKLLLMLCAVYLVWAFCIIYFNRSIL